MASHVADPILKITLVREVKADIPALKIDKKLLNEVGSLGSADIMHNILAGKQADGAGLKRNAPKTADRKRKKGWTVAGRVKSLIAEHHRFVKGGGRSWRWYLERGKTVWIYPGNAELKNLVRWVQMKGYLGWFAISVKGKVAIKLAMRDWIKKQFAKAAAKGGK